MCFLRSLFGICAVLALMLGVLPLLSHAWPFVFFGGMRLHIVIAAVVFSLAFLALVRSPWSAMPLLAALWMATWVGWLHYGLVQPGRDADQPHVTLKLIEFNMLHSNRNGAAIADWLEAQDADIVYALESNPIWRHLDTLSETYPYCAGCARAGFGDDLLVLSKFPLQDVSTMSLGKLASNRFIRSRIDVEGRQVTLVAMHLTKPYFDDLQQEELALARRLLRTVEGPVILGGDFNSSLLSPDIQAFAKSTGLRSHAHEPRTWPVSAPSIGLPIDHILVRPPAHIDTLARMEESLGSNHFGLIAEISVPVGPLAETGGAKAADP
ncbi:endonuclease/exonuclease/phosphatase family protein [Martelella lutilitoris]|uniref:Endonuclease/exonuclease/phosphatase family protein n=1 Tax=Martelella lutilitoris TaxID=2583532 RepID=A0A7T7HJS8_9HYPH|nr:endonuclease/exonuclease/phosphatase family protein [Martelella lutilitoris]QQM30481.1 endonuclease/exonuclease/phosphatase family protein [Martelella lutilitoris]